MCIALWTLNRGSHLRVTECLPCCLKSHISRSPVHHFWCQQASYSVPGNVRLEHSHADHKEHEHREGHHGEAQQDGSVLPHTGHWHLGPSSLPSMPIRPPLLLLSCRRVEQISVAHTHTHTHTHTRAYKGRHGHQGFSDLIQRWYKLDFWFDASTHFIFDSWNDLLHLINFSVLSNWVIFRAEMQNVS